MYTYFVSYMYSTDKGTGYGNRYVELDQPWNKYSHTFVGDSLAEGNYSLDTTLVIMNFQLLEEPDD